MNRYLRYMAAWVLIGAILLTPWACLTAWAQPPAGEEGMPAVPVEVERVTLDTVISRIPMVGSVRPWIETLTASETAGLVTWLGVREGDRVRKGDALCKLDASTLQFQIREAQAALRQAEARRERADREMKRQESLAATQSVAQKAYEDAFFEFKALSQETIRLEAVLLRLKDQFAKKTVVAPFAGFVVETNTEVGQWIAEGGPVARLFVTDPVKVIVPVPERHIGGISTGDRIDLRFDALGNRLFKGEVIAVIPMGNEASRTFPVHVRLENTNGPLKPGMLTRALFSVGEPKETLLVPRDAIVLSGGGGRYTRSWTMSR